MPIPFDQAPLAEQGERLVAQIDEDRPQMNHRHRKILHAFFAHPVNSNIHFRDVEKLFQELGAEVTHSHTGRLHLSLNRHSANFPTAWHSIPKEEVVRMRNSSSNAALIRSGTIRSTMTGHTKSATRSQIEQSSSTSGNPSSMQTDRPLSCILLALALLLGIVATAWAGDFEDGHAAYMHGDVDTALNLWTPLAEQGNAEAQYMLGLMYFNGRLVSKDDTEAAKWLNLAAEQGDEDAQYLLGLIDPSGTDVPMGSRK